MKRLREWWTRVTHTCRTPYFSQEWARVHEGDWWECQECGTRWTMRWIPDEVALEGTAVADIGGWEWVQNG